MAPASSLDGAREAFRRRAWGEARARYAAAEQDVALSLDDLEHFAIVSHLLGQDAESRDLLARGYRDARDHGEVARAARFAFWIGHDLIFTPDTGHAGGWFARARNLLSEQGANGPEWGLLLVPTGVDQLYAGESAAACATFTEALAIGRRFADTDLVAIAGHGRGRALIRLGHIAEGMSALDEVMVAVASGEVSPFAVGHLYCGVLEACQEAFDLRRAREWTAALSRWCEGQPDLVPYRGPCLVHRVELMRLRGDWADALEEAKRACEWLSMPSSPEGPGNALYELAELHRLQGDLATAEEAYREANRWGARTEPGLALLWSAGGRGAASATALRRALDEEGADRAHRATLLDAYVEVLLAMGRVDEARQAADELRGLAGDLDALTVRAMADRAAASLLIAEGHPREALPLLRRAWMAWQQLEAPYEGARARVLMAEACRALGDEESAAMEVDAARWVFARLGALPDLARLDPLPTAVSGSPSGLTPRELEVLALVAAGQTNKAIAAELVISEHTVARHVQNMLAKLGFASRASLAAFAVEQGLTRAAAHGEN